MIERESVLNHLGYTHPTLFSFPFIFYGKCASFPLISRLETFISEIYNNVQTDLLCSETKEIKGIIWRIWKVQGSSLTHAYLKSAFYPRLGNPAMARQLIVIITKWRKWCILFIEKTTKEYSPRSAIYFLQLIYLYPT